MLGFVLGFVLAKGDSVVVLLCRRCVETVPALKEMDWNIGRWCSLIIDKKFVGWLVPPPPETCEYKYDEAKRDVELIGWSNQPGTAFASLPSNYRCPTCRSSMDSFTESIEEIAGFEVNQGYGFGTNAMTEGQKN